MISKDELIKRFRQVSIGYLGKDSKDLTKYECYIALCGVIRSIAGQVHRENREHIKNNDEKFIYYFSMEFLIGKLLNCYLINLNIKDIVEDALNTLGFSLEEIEELEIDPGLGNGGLGRLAACFLDSIASLGLNGMGMGVRYRFGLFKQKIVNGEQIEIADNWLDKGYPWEHKREDRAVKVKFGGYVDKIYENGDINFVYKNYEEVLAIPYDVPIIGYEGKSVNKLRLWYAQPVEENFDLSAFNKGDYSKAVDHRNRIEAISSILYPDDTNQVGKKLRLQQEYLLVAAGISDIINRYKRKYGNDMWHEFHKHVIIHINDTHPTMCIPELIRVFVDEMGLTWDEAYNITTNTIAYTNHTVLPEALEKWPIPLMKEQLPRIYMIIEEIDRRYHERFDRSNQKDANLLRKTAILWDNNVYMANLSTICSFSVNGVASLHTEILKRDTLKEFYELMPEKFNNKTNGISHRRFLLSANENLSNLISETIGDQFKTDANCLKDLLRFENDNAFLEKMSNVKKQNKIRLAKYIKEHNDIVIDPDSIFDIQVKRIHAYKRQLLNAFKILNLYNEIKNGKITNIHPTTFIFSGKAAGSYLYAKKTIKFINTLADMINKDNHVNKFIKVVFIENFCVSNAELIYPAADISEQISTAGKEASGTGNMKFMFNGAITLGTMDGANVEIYNLIGNDNIKIFGLRAEEVEDMVRNNTYNSNEVANNDDRLKQIREQLINGFFDGYNTDFWDIHDSLFTYGDEYFVVKDFDDYIKKYFELIDLYTYNKHMFDKISLVNIANAGYFSSDRTILEYYNDIWNKQK